MSDPVPASLSPADLQEAISTDSRRRWADMDIESETMALAEEACEALAAMFRAVVKRRHGTRGTYEEWTTKLRQEVAQTGAVLFNIAAIEGWDLFTAIEDEHRRWVATDTNHDSLSAPPTPERLKPLLQLATKWNDGAEAIRTRDPYPGLDSIAAARTLDATAAELRLAVLALTEYPTPSSGERLEALERENERLHVNLDTCVAHLDLLQAAMQGRTKFVCALCGAEAAEDHDAACPLLASSARLKSLALTSLSAPKEGE